MTLIELLVSISVLGIIVGPVTIMMMLGLINGTSTRERISDSTAAQLTSTYYVPDVESAETVVIPTTTTPTCGTDAGTVKLRLTWSDPTDPSVVTNQTLVEYIDRATGDNGLHDLWRYECDRSATPIVRSTKRLVRSVDFAGLGTPPVTCNSAAAACPTGTNRTVSDGVTNSTTTVQSTTANFVSGDVGMTVGGSGIPTGATVVSVTNSSTIVISAAATATSSGVKLALGPPVSVFFKIQVNANSGGSGGAKANTNSYTPYTFTLQAQRRESTQ